MRIYFKQNSKTGLAIIFFFISGGIGMRGLMDYRININGKTAQERYTVQECPSFLRINLPKKFNSNEMFGKK